MWLPAIHFLSKQNSCVTREGCRGSTGPGSWRQIVPRTPELPSLEGDANLLAAMQLSPRPFSLVPNHKLGSPVSHNYAFFVILGSNHFKERTQRWFWVFSFCQFPVDTMEGGGVSNTCCSRPPEGDHGHLRSVRVGHLCVQWMRQTAWLQLSHRPAGRSLLRLLRVLTLCRLLKHVLIIILTCIKPHIVNDYVKT